VTLQDDEFAARRIVRWACRSSGWARALAQVPRHRSLAHERSPQEEAFAGRLREAGVPVISVRFQGTIHDFVVLNALSATQATRAALVLATGVLRRALGPDT
jgi:acetyl esterase/lipase